MNTALQELVDRGFLSQCTDSEGLSLAMDAGPVTFYVGTDPTGPSLHIGHMVPFFAFRHLVKAGHRGIALIGGGTARIGDPSGKTEMRKMITEEEIEDHSQRFEQQLGRFLGGFNGSSIRLANNKDWLSQLNYISFLREIGVHFSVNRMLSFEAYKRRLETGLTFIEFNYQLLQSYDYLELFRREGAKLQIGGDDQWGNIVAGMELIRRVEGASAFGLTFPLVTTSDGKKMGKTEKGALFLDPALTPVFDFYQYWRNIPDTDVTRFLLLFTFLPVAECRSLGSRKDAALNEVKELLAYEVTALIHGPAEAQKARSAASAAFRGSSDLEALPTFALDDERWQAGVPAAELLVLAGMCTSKSEARRLIQQGGGQIFSRRLEDPEERLGRAQSEHDALVLRAGKKKVMRIIPQGAGHEA